MRNLMMIGSLLTLLGCGAKIDAAFRNLVDKAMTDLRTN